LLIVRTVYVLKESKRACAPGSGGVGELLAAAAAAEEVDMEGSRMSWAPPREEEEEEEEVQYSLEQLQSLFGRYAASHGLQNPRHGKKWRCDALILSALGIEKQQKFAGLEEEPTVSKADCGRRLAERMSEQHVITLPNDRAVGSKGGTAAGATMLTKVHSGPPPQMSVATTAKMGHGVTLVRGMESYSFP